MERSLATGGSSLSVSCTRIATHAGVVQFYRRFWRPRSSTVAIEERRRRRQQQQRGAEFDKQHKPRVRRRITRRRNLNGDLPTTTLNQSISLFSRYFHSPFSRYIYIFPFTSKEKPFFPPIPKIYSIFASFLTLATCTEYYLLPLL